MAGDLAPLAVVAAGLLSFLSPCVLPLVPPYLAFLAGESLADLAEAPHTNPQLRRHAVRTALCFVAGFSLIFIAMGAGASLIGTVLRTYSDTLAKISGVVILGMGLHFLGVFRLAILAREKRVTLPKPPGLVGAFIMGLAFAFGWTPCIGPVLAGVLTLASAEESVVRGALLLALYSAGLGIPFLLAAFAMAPFARFSAHVKTRMVWIERAMGGLLVLTGLAFLTGSMGQVGFWLLEAFPILGRLG